MIFFDTETTGLVKNAALPLNQQPRIIEFGAVKITDGKQEQLEILINPGIKLEPIITKVTGLTDEDLLGKPRFAHVAEKIQDFFLGEDTMVAHNLPFDHQMLIFEMRRCGLEFKFPWPKNHIDTIDLAKPHYRGKFMKLEVLYEDRIGPVQQKHRALDDVGMLIEVYETLI